MQRVALASIGQHADAKSVAAVAKVMRSHESWAMRVLAAQALGRLGARAGRRGAEATRQLKEAATKESYALVREAALVALSTYDENEASQLAAIDGAVRSPSRASARPRRRSAPASEVVAKLTVSMTRFVIPDGVNPLVLVIATAALALRDAHGHGVSRTSRASRARTATTSKATS